MLVLSRKANQKIVIPSIDATIQILEIRGNTVRIGIAAPTDVTILRAELLQARGEAHRRPVTVGPAISASHADGNIDSSKSSVDWHADLG